MKITKGNSIVANDVNIYSSVFTKAIGMMFSQPKNLLFVFEKEDIIPLHTFFVFFPIDIVYLDKNKKVVEKTCMKPFAYYKPKNKAKYVIEFGKSIKQNIRISDKLSF